MFCVHVLQFTMGKKGQRDTLLMYYFPCHPVTPGILLTPALWVWGKKTSIKGKRQRTEIQDCLSDLCERKHCILPLALHRARLLLLAPLPFAGHLLRDGQGDGPLQA